MFEYFLQADIYIYIITVPFIVKRKKCLMLKGNIVVAVTMATDIPTIVTLSIGDCIKALFPRVYVSPLINKKNIYL